MVASSISLNNEIENCIELNSVLDQFGDWTLRWEVKVFFKFF